jgi:hypothetical protein
MDVKTPRDDRLAEFQYCLQVGLRESLDKWERLI